MIINDFLSQQLRAAPESTGLVFGNRFREYGAQCLAPATIDPDAAKKSATT
jgi:hypothetical protein